MNDIIDRKLAAVRACLQAAADAHATGAAIPRDLEDPPCDASLPISWLRTRLGLTATEERVIWLLVAHELCPDTRRLVRELNSEPVFDPTLDTIRRVVYGAPTDRRAWEELGPEAPVWRLGL